MKQYIPCLLLIGMALPIGAITNESSDTDISGRSYLAVQPHFHSSSPELVSGFRGDRSLARQDGWHGAMQFVLFGSRSTHHDNLARYFLPFGKTSLVASEDFKSFKGLTFSDNDILVGNFNIITTGGLNPPGFKSRISIKPKQSVIGFGIEYRQSLWQNEEKGRGLWLDVTLPITHVKNELNLEETILNTDNDNTPANVNTGVGDGPVGNMVDAFKQKGFLYGKIDDNADAMKRTGVADMEIKLGYEWLQNSPCHLESYIGLIIPTGNAPKGEYVFEAVVGSGKHVGLTFGSNFGTQVWCNENEERCLRVEHASHSQYLFEKEHVRSFDLKNRPWSRYLSMYASAENAAAAASATDSARQNAFTPGINILTREVKVTPGFSHNMNTALVYQSKGLALEGGYNFFARRAEHVELDTSLPATAALKDISGAGQTNPLRDISGTSQIEQAIITTNDGNLPVALANYSQSIITTDDLDLASASTPCNIAHTIYANLGYNWDEREYPMGLHLGGSYTFSNSNNSVVDRWTLWSKFTISI